MAPGSRLSEHPSDPSSESTSDPDSTERSEHGAPEADGKGLELVGRGSGPTAQGTRVGVADESGSEERSRRGLPIWLFVLVFVLFSLALGWQASTARRLEGEVARLEQALAGSRALLGAHRDHLGEIRTGVADLTARLDGLKRLVDASPEDRLSEASPDSAPADGSIDAGTPADRGTSSSLPRRLPGS